jgi:hypothetical protein
MSTVRIARRFHLSNFPRKFQVSKTVRRGVPVLTARPALYTLNFKHVQLGEQRWMRSEWTHGEERARPWSAKVAVQPRPRPLGKQGIHTHSQHMHGQGVAIDSGPPPLLPAWRTHAGEWTRPREPADFNAACCGIHMHGRRWLTIVRQIQFSSPGKNDLGKIIRIFIRVPYRVALGALLDIIIFWPVVSIHVRYQPA